MSVRDEIDARISRCDQAKLRPGFNAFPPVKGACQYAPPHLLSHEEAQAAGHAMYDRWVQQAMPEAPGMGGGFPAPMPRDDTGWADLARAAWEAAWALRRERGQ